ncbi:MAG: UDP-N-acetylglucosamine 1-carboxyvinyltransferase [Clostridia bacterium]|nr:UDP-N-acetylglucosamine 1-carboxyvinyltransferase [Clostridia bacterium]
MDKFVINGNKSLYGEVDISGAKNAAVAILPAALLNKGTCTIENIPDVKDINYILDVIGRLGAKVERLSRNSVRIDASGDIATVADFEVLNHMRASYYIVGALLGRFGNAEVSMPGGCNFGERPVDLHKKGFTALGADVSVSGIFKAKTTLPLKGANIYLDTVSVGATINIMIAAVLAEGTTIIENVAKEPHIVDVANFLNAMGANVKGAGTDVIRIKGVKELNKNINYALIPDQIEAGTFMVAAAAAGGNVLIKNVIPKHMEAISAKLEEMNITVQEFSDSIRIISDGTVGKANLKTLPYPGFPTDMQPIAVALLTVAKGTSIVTEGVWENRFQYVDELRRMGAHITVNGRMAVIEGVDKLTGAVVNATDLRAGAALVVAGLMAEGKTVIRNIKYIDRGYEHFAEKLRSIGADIQRDSDPSN